MFDFKNKQINNSIKHCFYNVYIKKPKANMLQKYNNLGYKKSKLPSIISLWPMYLN